MVRLYRNLANESNDQASRESEPLESTDSLAKASMLVKLTGWRPESLFTMYSRKPP